jgi:hypothetical protein
MLFGLVKMWGRPNLSMSVICCLLIPNIHKVVQYDRDKLWLVYTQIVPVIYEPPCTVNYQDLQQACDTIQHQSNYVFWQNDIFPPSKTASLSYGPAWTYSPPDTQSSKLHCDAVHTSYLPSQLDSSTLAFASVYYVKCTTMPSTLLQLRHKYISHLHAWD